jgi:hypothetical protein
MRPGPSLPPGGGFSQPLDASQWLMGLLLLLLSAAPLGMILVLHFEETGSTYAVRRAATVHRGPKMPAEPDRTSSGTSPGLRQPAS